MSWYRRRQQAGGLFFVTVVTYARRPVLTTDAGRHERLESDRNARPAAQRSRLPLPAEASRQGVRTAHTRWGRRPRLAEEVLPRLKGRAYLIRYADDFVIGFTDDEDARRVMAVLPKRLGKYGLSIHPDKTRLLPFRKRKGERRSCGGEGPGTFRFLGFTHGWARSRKGNWYLLRKTAADRFTRAVRTISQWCRTHRHDPIEEQHKTLCQKLQGHAAYYGITGNSPALARFRREAGEVWRKWLLRRRRAWRPRAGWFGRLLDRYPVPYLRCVHSVYRSVANG